MLTSNKRQNRMRTFFRRLSTLPEDSQENAEEDLSEYEIIEAIEGIYEYLHVFL
jgi:hypothetical protein